MVEAIEDEFIPVLVFNNKPEDEAILKSFDEPAWNNPVVRFLKDGRDVIERKDGVWELQPLAARMQEALAAARRDVPAYLRLLANDSSFAANRSSSLERATFAMHCFWEGEAKFGSLPGVLETQAVWVNDLEAVDIVFDPAQIDYRRLVEQAALLQCTARVFARSDVQFDIAKDFVGDRAQRVTIDFAPRPAEDSQQKYYLRNSRFAKLPLTELQAVRINSLLSRGSIDASEIYNLLSPRQRAQMNQ